MDFLKGLIFAILWASATVATKIGLHSVEPFLLTAIRFAVVSILLLLYVHGYKGRQYAFPRTKDFRGLVLLGVLNITVYMTGYIIAIKHVSAGLISLVSATNPLILILLSAAVSGRKLKWYEYTGMVISLSGLCLAAVPNLSDPHATFTGIAALVAGIVALSAGSVYYSRCGLTLPKIVVNTWQITIGGLLFIPIVLLDPTPHYLIPDTRFFLTLGWLVLPVSIVASGLWLFLVHKDAVRAGMWLFLTPALGYFLAVLILHEKLTWFGICGAVLVVTGLMIARKRKQLA
ncbi:DMT family transporter [Sediminibacterium ginsengisoli]|uniref:Permease of the drug/metabolite transporter (DMT) superfamily n=1 Tax=Sediminibacterium ginsengisoli TaxID=413434 RepID=A0A1T4P769_9BACT|nr:DMT family transporter [Sediminibacterium ginsengisoli]SJZ86748.1 Permease of the drug/metabolite transporter (DMT) superfamily [Sediminibacterium ginsengisoli]